ncbi:MlaE family ABC transporter permease [Helicobacter sp. 23-1044]
MIDSAIKNNSANITLHGDFGKNIPKADIEALQNLSQNLQLKHYALNLDFINSFDFSFLIFIYTLGQDITKRGGEITLTATTDKAKHIANLLREIEIKEAQIIPPPKENIFIKSAHEIGVLLYGWWAAFVEFLNFTGVLLYFLSKSILHPKEIRLRAINYHIFNSVIAAMPVIFIVSFVVGGVIAYQGAATLERMGFVNLSVEMTAKLTLREIGPFVVAMIVAGRSASAYTAQIGVMKMTEEISAMKTMQLNLMNFIVLPRFYALVISFPLMVFLSDLISLFGCMVFLHFGFEIGFGEYVAQIKSSVGMNSFWTGIIKAPFYAAAVVIIGCFIGFRVEGNTQSVGEKTTTSVVCALFGVIIINALFSLIFTELRF